MLVPMSPQRRVRHRLMIFARFPERGRVKSRLAAELGEETALAIYRAMLDDLLDSIGTSDSTTEVELLWTGGEQASGAEILSTFRHHRICMQSGTNLGERLVTAFAERIHFHRARRVIAIGVDVPHLSRAMIDSAFALLESFDWVVGPATDGGYYLIGARAAAFDLAVFEGVDWGSSRVLDQTLATIRGRGQNIALLPEMSDIDRPDDLRTIGNPTPRLAEVLRQIDWENDGGGR
jgi:uncharacterized protein